MSRIDELENPVEGHAPEEYFKLCVDDDEMFIVAEEEGKIVGYILGEPMKGNVAYVGFLTVSEEMRGKGVGKMLVEAFRKRCDEKGLTFLFLFAPKWNENTLAFYNSCGFTKGREFVHFAEVREKR